MAEDGVVIGIERVGGCRGGGPTDHLHVGGVAVAGDGLTVGGDGNGVAEEVAAREIAEKV